MFASKFTEQDVFSVPVSPAARVARRELSEVTGAPSRDADDARAPTRDVTPRARRRGGAMAPDDAWTPVTRAGKRAIGARAEAALAARAAATNRAVDARAEEAALSAEELAARVAACATRVERATADVRAATRLDAAVDAVRDAAATRARGRAVTVLALGLGSPDASAAARCQLAFASRACERLRERSNDDATRVRLKAYDPCFTIVDEKVLAGDGDECETLTRERCDEYVSASSSTKDELVVFYMPHCEGHLYEDVVRARWSVGALRDLVCVGNTFETYADRWRAKSADPEKKRPSHVIAASSIARASLLDPGDTFAVQGAFNDTSVQTFELESDEELPAVVDAS